jgi:hypothetical protein
MWIEEQIFIATKIKRKKSATAPNPRFALEGREPWKKKKKLNQTLVVVF